MTRNEVLFVVGALAFILGIILMINEAWVAMGISFAVFLGICFKGITGEGNTLLWGPNKGKTRREVAQSDL